MARPKKVMQLKRFVAFVPNPVSDSEERAERALVDQAFKEARQEGEQEAKERGIFFKL